MMNYPIGIVKDVEVRIGKLKPLNNLYVIDMKKDPETPLPVGRGLLATANAIIDCIKAKIAVEEGITRSVFGVKGVDLGAQTLYYTRKDFLDCHLPGEWEIAKDAKINPFKDVIVFRRMMEKNSPKPYNQSPPLESSPKEKVQGRSSTWTTSMTPNDMVRALLLDKKNQSSAQATSSTPSPIKEVESNCVTCGDGKIHVKYRSFHSIRAESPYDTKWAKMAQGKDGPPKSPSKGRPPPMGYIYPLIALERETSKGNGGRYEHANPVSLKAQDGGDHMAMNRDYAWLMISRQSSSKVEGVTRLKKYSELSAAEAIQADYDVKATNIILQGLPPEVYAL
nr:hypothetical protein [Tanacetum cinerariifolium]